MNTLLSALHTDVDHQIGPDITLRDGHGLTEGTRATYARSRKLFAEWCETNGRRALPATAATVLTYAHELTRREWAPSTIILHIAAITRWHEDSEMTRPDPRRAHLLVREYAHQRAAQGYRPRRVDPITVEDLRVLVESCRTGTVGGARDETLLLLGFALMARQSILPRVDLADLKFRAEGLQVSVRYDKRQPTGRIVAIPKLHDGDPLCIVAGVKRWVTILRAHDITTGPLLRPVSYANRPHATRGLSPRSVQGLFNRIIERAGMSDDFDFTPHSLRAGAATAAYGAGADVIDIAQQGGWVPGSSALWLYIRGRDTWTNNPIHKALTRPRDPVE